MKKKCLLFRWSIYIAVLLISSGSYATVGTTANDQLMDPIQITLVKSNVTCYGGSDGSIQTSVSGGVSPYTYQWSTGSTLKDLTGLPAGTYQLTVTDFNGDQETETIGISQPSQIDLSNTVISHTSCNGFSDGSVNLVVAGGNAPYTYQWSTGATTEDIAGLTAGTYKVTVTDANGCQKISVPGFTVYEPASLSFVGTTVQDVSCNNGNDGIIDLTVSGGTLGYNYNWSTGAVTEDVGGLSVGTYYVTVTDANGCSAVSPNGYTISQPTPISVSVTTTNVSCAGADDGALDLFVTGGTAPYSYSWSNGDSTEDISGLAPGTYMVTISDSNDCQTSAPVGFVISEPLPLTLSASSVTDVSCPGGNDGSVDITISGGTALYSYQWSNGAVTEDVTGLSTGTYSVTVTDTNSCTNDSTLSFVVSEPQPMILSSLTVSDVSCNGSNDGSLNISIGGGVAPYSYLWNTGATSEDISGLAPGNYTLTVTDANGCSMTFSNGLSISEPQPLNLSYSAKQTTCSSNCDGEIDLTISGGTPPFAYSWANGASTEDLDSLCAGNYTVTVTDANGCVGNLSVIIGNSVPVMITSNVSDISCIGSCDGAIVTNVFGGTAPYIYSWSNGATSSVIGSLCSGSYSLTVTDANGCIAFITETLNDPQPLIVSASVSDVSCSGNNDGSIKLNVSGGNAPYTFQWTNNDTTKNISKLQSGTYSVIVTDNNNCPADTFSFTVKEPAPITINAQVTAQSDCQGNTLGNIDLSVSGGTPPYTYLWSNGDNTEDITNQPVGTYQVTVTDNNGCQVNTVSGYSITTQPMLAISYSVIPESCNSAQDGAIQLNATGGNAPYSYSWSTGATTANIQGISSGNYQVMVNDSQGCTDSLNITVGIDQAMLITASITPDNCQTASGAIDLSIQNGSGNYAYKWNNGDDTKNITGLLAGTYFITVTDTISGCAATNIFTVSNSNQLFANAQVINSDCGGNTGSVEVFVQNGSGNYDYNWSNGGPNSSLLNNLAPGIYTCTITDSTSGCSATVSATIQSQNGPVVNGFIQKATDCKSSDGSISLSASGGSGHYSYLWSTGDTTSGAANLSAGSYTMTLTDDTTGCVSILSFTVGANNSLVLSAQATAASCGASNGAIYLSVAGGTGNYSYKWSNGEVTKDLQQIKSGQYMVTVTDNNSGCQEILLLSLGTSNGPSVTVNYKDASCAPGAGGEAEAMVTGGSGSYIYNWSTGDNTAKVTNLLPGTYSVNILDSITGCSNSASITISAPGNINLAANKLDVSCYGGNDGMIDLQVSGGSAPFTYSWSNNQISQDIASLSSGLYSVTVTDSLGCSATMNIAVSQPLALKMNKNITMPGCNQKNGTISINVKGGSGNYTILWSNGMLGDSISNIGAGFYAVKVIDQNNGCFIIDTVKLMEPELVVNSTNKDATCDTLNGQIELNVSGGSGYYKYFWSTGAETKDLTGIDEGNYIVLIEDTISGCSETYAASIQQTGSPELTLKTVPVNCSQGAGSASVNVTGGVPPYTFSWSNGENSEEISVITSGLYNVTVSDSKGCENKAMASIECLPESELIIYNVLTPNNDGKNDTWIIEGIEEHPNSQIQIFNRWGDRVYRTTGYENEWDGSYGLEKGILMDGTYYYLIKLNDETQREYNGFLIIAR